MLGAPRSGQSRWSTFSGTGGRGDWGGGRQVGVLSRGGVLAGIRCFGAEGMWGL